MEMDHCPQCGAPIEEEEKCCPNCGCKLEELRGDSRTEKLDEDDLVQRIQQRIQGNEHVNIVDRWGNVNPTDVRQASFGNRFMAWLLDQLITLAMAIPAILLALYSLIQTGLFPHVFNNNVRDTNTIFIVYLFLSTILFLPPILYSLLKDGMKNGQSYGKRWMGIRVISLDNGAPCTYWQSLARQIVGALISSIPAFGWLVEPLMVLCTDDGRRLADRAAGTFVVQDK